MPEAVDANAANKYALPKILMIVSCYSPTLSRLFGTRLPIGMMNGTKLERALRLRLDRSVDFERGALAR
jgi:hypothetical protein